MSPDDPRRASLYEALNAITTKRRPALERVEEIRELRESLRDHITQAMRSQATAHRPNGPKIMPDGRVQEGFIRAFVQEQGATAA